MIEFLMHLLRLILIAGLVGQLLWAQGTLLPQQPCSLAVAEVTDRPASKADSPQGGCCRKSKPMRSEANVASCGKSPKPEPTPARRCAPPDPPSGCPGPESVAAGEFPDGNLPCGRIGCCRRNILPQRRPVDRVPAGEKRPKIPPAIIARSVEITSYRPVVPQATRVNSAQPPCRTRQAMLCVWLS